MIVQCVMLTGLELRHQRCFWNVAEHMRCSKSWNWDFRLVPTSRGVRERLCLMLNDLELRRRRCFWNVAEHMRCSKGWNWDFKLVPMSRGMRPPKNFSSLQTKGENLNRWACAQIVWVLQSLELSGSYLPDEIVMVLQKSLPPSYWSFVMDYNISGIDMMILELFAMFDTAKVEIK